MKIRPETAKWADEAVREGRKVRIIDVNSKKKFFNPVPFFITAVEDTEQRTLLLGSELNGTETGEFKARKEAIYEAAKQLVLRPEKSADNNDEEVSAQIGCNHLQQFDLSNNKDAAIFYLCVMNDSSFAPSLAELNPGSHRFWFEDRRRESSQKRNEIQIKVNALKRIREFQPDDLTGVYRLVIGHKPEGLGYEDQLADLEIFADENPEIANKMMNDPKLVAKIFAMQLLNNDLLSYQRYTGNYYDGENKIGTSLDSVVDYITAPENSKLKDQWGKILMARGNNKSRNVSKPAGSTAEA